MECALHKCSTTGRKSPGSGAESASLEGQDPPVLRKQARGQLAIATVMYASGDTIHQHNGAYSRTELLQTTGRLCLPRAQDFKEGGIREVGSLLLAPSATATAPCPLSHHLFAAMPRMPT